MQFLQPIAIVLSVLGLASAQTVYISALPMCAQIPASFTTQGGCKATDFTCLCRAPTLFDLYSTSLALVCSKADADASIQWGVDYCASVKLPVSASGFVAGTLAPMTATSTAVVAKSTAGAVTTTAASTTATAKSGVEKVVMGGGSIGVAVVAALMMGL